LRYFGSSGGQGRSLSFAAQKVRLMESRIGKISIQPQHRLARFNWRIAKALQADSFLAEHGSA
jgi:hypothetical protein